MTEANIEVGNEVEGVVVKLLNYGAIVEVGEKKGLLHISKVSDNFVKNLRDFIKEGDIIKVKIEEIRNDGKLNFSLIETIKKAEPKHKRKTPKIYDFDPKKAWAKGPMKRNLAGPDSSFEDKLKGFLKESDEKRLDIKRSLEAKRG